jgi:hypothetical protein
MISYGTHNAWFLLPCITVIYDPKGEVIEKGFEIGLYFLNAYLTVKL